MFLLPLIEMDNCIYIRLDAKFGMPLLKHLFTVRNPSSLRHYMLLSTDGIRMSMGKTHIRCPTIHSTDSEVGHQYDKC